MTIPSVAESGATGEANDFRNAVSRPYAPVAILATPKTGNLWLRFCLERGLQLRSVDPTSEEEIQTLLDNYVREQPANPFIFHAHLESTEARRQSFAEARVNLVTLLRHPIDIFLSLCRHHRRLATQTWPDNLLVSDATIEDYVNFIFPAQLGISASWARVGSSIVRYEEMINNPQQVYCRLLGTWRPGSDHTALSTFMTRIGSLEILRQSAGIETGDHFTVGRADQWRWLVNRPILAMFQRNKALMRIIEDWGYSADPDEPVKDTASPADAGITDPDPLDGISAFDNGVPFSAFLKIIFYFYYCHKTATFDFAHPTVTDDCSFFAWLTRPHGGGTHTLNNLEYEVMRFRKDVVRMCQGAHDFEYDSFRQWLHVYGLRDLALPPILLQDTAIAMGRLKVAPVPANVSTPSPRNTGAATVPFLSY